MMIRKALESDWNIISEISKLSGYDDYINRHGRNYMDSGIIYVNDDDCVNAFIKAEFMPDNSLWFSGLRVHPDYRNQNIATSLLLFLKKFATDSGYSHLGCLVETTNTKSVNLMKKNHMDIIETYNFYNSGIDVSGYSYADLNTSHMVNINWKFAEIKNGFMIEKNNIVYSHSDNINIYTVISGDDLKLIDTGYTCAPAKFDGLIKHEKDPEFPSGYVFRLNLNS